MLKRKGPLLEIKQVETPQEQDFVSTPERVCNYIDNTLNHSLLLTGWKGSHSQFPDGTTKINLAYDPDAEPRGDVQFFYPFRDAADFPKTEHEKRMVKEAIYVALDSLNHGPVVLFCVNGTNRTMAVFAGVLMVRSGKSFTKALDVVTEIRPASIKDGLVDFLKGFNNTSE